MTFNSGLVVILYLQVIILCLSLHVGLVWFPEVVFVITFLLGLFAFWVSLLFWYCVWFIGVVGFLCVVVEW